MLFTKPTTEGVDTRIQEIQIGLHDFLLSRWGIESRLYNAYGRAYATQEVDGNGYIPEVFKGSGKKDYDDPLTDDTKLATSFFGLTDDIKLDGSKGTATLHLIFCVNLRRLKPQLNYRADEDVHNDVRIGLNESSAGPITIKSFELKMASVFREYSGYRTQSGMKFRDMNPYHYFRINFSTNFLYNNC